HLTRLAEVLGAASGLLRRSAAGVRLAGPGLVTDLDSVDEAVDAGRAAATAGDGAGAATALRRALSRWPGPVADDLPGLPALAVRRATEDADGGPGHDRDDVLRPVERAALRRSRMPLARTEDSGRRPSLVWVDVAGRALSRALPATGSILVGRDAGADVPLAD